MRPQRDLDYYIRRLLHEYQRGGVAQVFKRSALKLTVSLSESLMSLVPEYAFNRYILERLMTRPRVLHLETTNICNARCSFCAYRLMERPKGIMQKSIFEKAVADFVEIGGGDVDLTPLVGDPLTDREILNRIRYLRSLPSIGKITFFTNGIALDKIPIRDLLSSGVNEIVVSVGGANREEYRALFGVDAFERVCNNMEKLGEINENASSPVRLAMSYKPFHNGPDLLPQGPLARLRGYFEPLGMMDYHNWGGKIRDGDIPGGMQPRYNYVKKEPCALLYSGLAVTWNGDIVACWCSNAEGELKLGNIMEDSLINVWKGKRLSQLREGFYNGILPPVCRPCSFYEGISTLKTMQNFLEAKRNYERFSRSKDNL